MLRLVLFFLMAYLTSVILATEDLKLGPPKVLIDGHTVNESFESQANLPLGITLVLVCHERGFPNGTTPKYTWTCPNKPCIRQRNAGRMIGDKWNVLAINITSKRDNGIYTCKVSADGYEEGSGKFHLKVTGGEVVHSYGRLILNERVISNRRQLQPLNNPKGDGRIECRVSSGKAGFTYHGSNRNIAKVHQTLDHSGSIATVVIKRRALNPRKFAIDGQCANLYHYLFLKEDANCHNLTLDPPRVTNVGITVSINKLQPPGIARYIVGYAKLDRGVWVQGEYANLQLWETRTFSSLVPGTKYRVTVWGLSGGDTDDRKRCQSPNVMYVSTLSKPASQPRVMNVIGDGNEAQMHWIHPKLPNGDISHFKIEYAVKNGTQHEIITPYNHHTLTGMEVGYSYNITLMAVHRDGLEGERVMKTYVHFP